MERFTTLIDIDTFAGTFQQPGWVIVDCRFRLDDPDAGRQSYLDSHIPGAVYADLNKDLAAEAGGEQGRHPLPNLDDFRARLGGWGISADSQVVCYDDSGGAYAARFWWMLRYLGHEAVAVLDGGWSSWLARALPTRGGNEQNRTATFSGEPREEMVASFGDVAALSRNAGLLIDSRDAARFRGEVEPIDPVAGHIPGARNRPYLENLSNEGFMRPVDELRQEWNALLSGRAPSEAVVYCGSGVSACQNLLAMARAGLDGARLFVPSWSGWSADPERPVEQG